METPDGAEPVDDHVPAEEPAGRLTLKLKRTLLSLLLLFAALVGAYAVSTNEAYSLWRLAHPAAGVVSFWESWLDRASAGLAPSYGERLFQMGGATMEDEVTLAATDYLDVIHDGRDGVEALRARLVVLLAEGGQWEDAREHWHQLRTRYPAYALTVATAYPKIAPEEVQGPGNVDSGPMEDIDVLDPRARWTIDQLELRWSQQTGDSQRAEAIEVRRRERAIARKESGVVLIDAVALATVLGLFVLCFLLWRPRSRNEASWEAPWSFQDGIVIITTGTVFFAMAYATSGCGMGYVPLLHGWFVVPAYLPMVWLFRNLCLQPFERTFTETFRLRPSRVGWPRIVLWTLALYSLHQLLWALLVRLPLDFPWSEGWQEQVVSGSLPVTVSSVIGGVLLAPVFEETVYRGIVFGTLSPRTGGFNAAVISSWIFAATHGYSFAGFCSIFAIGLILAFGFARTGSLLVPMIVHGLINLGIFGTLWAGYRV
jgi:membrane protease YdiL (CAAX protease family)